MVALGSKAPDFTLTDVVSKKVIKLSKEKGEHATVIMFICNHCPYVKHINHVLPKLAENYHSKGVVFIAINSNDAKNYPDDSPENMIETAHNNQYNFPYLFDETQEVAKAFQATCTPDFFIYDNGLNLVYRGQLDDSRPGNGIEVTGQSLKKALDAQLSQKSIIPDQKPSIGCNIKWKNN
tara:strand:+ start:242 stop:781 length:540 start_codon:yes stop_codon:yes gene_type:complete